MFCVTQDVTEVRTWAQSRGGWPCRRLDGRLALGFAGEICRGVRIGWAEFEVNFRMTHCQLVHDDAPGSTLCFVGTGQEAKRFLLDGAGWNHETRATA